MAAHDGILLPGSGNRRLQRRFIPGNFGSQRLDFGLSDAPLRSNVFRFREPAPGVIEGDTRLSFFRDRTLQCQAREFAVQLDENRTFLDPVAGIHERFFHQSANGWRQDRRLW